MQPMSHKVLQQATSLERICLSYILGYTIKSAQYSRAMAISRLVPIRYHRRLHLVTAVKKFHTAATHPDATRKAQRTCNVLIEFETVKSLLRRLPIRYDMNSWVLHHQNCVYEESYKYANSYVRKVPLSETSKLPPALRGDFITAVEKKVVQWDFNRLKMVEPQLRALNPRLASLLQSDNLSVDEQSELESTLLLFCD